MNLYPPIVESSIPAFPQGSTCIFPYTISKYNDTIDVKHVQVSVCYQDSGKSALNPTAYPHEILFANRGVSDTAIFIPSSALAEGWKQGKIYKIQLRFGTEILPSTNPSSSWISQQIEKGTFSEWSAVTIVKVTGNATLKIIGFEEGNAINYVSSQAFNFKGSYSNTDITEAELQYKFSLYNYNDNNSLVETSDWQYHLNTKEDEFVFRSLLRDDIIYEIKYEVKTKNGLEKSITYRFNAIDDSLSLIDVNIEPELDKEEGRILVKITGKPYIGNFILRRTDSKTNYSVWEDYKYFLIEGQSINIQEYDYLVENGVIYKYAIQKINKNGLRGAMKISPAILCTFHYGYLYADGVQFKLEFDHEVSSFKRNKFRTKQDTIGNKYPFIFENGHVDYFSFPLSCTISMEEDEQETFIKKRQLYSYDLNPDVLANYDALYKQFEDDVDKQYFLENKFRYYVEEWLNNGKPKLYKSLTEGNIVVDLLDINLSPKKELYRMIYSFSSTAYQIGETNLNEYEKLHIHSIGEYMPIDDSKWYEMGQIKAPLRGLYHFDKITGIISANDIPEGLEFPYNDIRLEIEDQRNVANPQDEYRTVVDKVVGIYIEAPPMTKFFMKSGNHPIQQMATNKNGVYTLEVNDNVDITQMYFLYDQEKEDDIVINYITQMKLEENEHKVLKSSKVERYWGQLHGFFNPDIILYNKPIINKINTNKFGNNIYLSLDVKELLLNKIIDQDIVTILANENYSFIDIDYLYIECDEGVTAILNDQEVYIGPTNSYELDDNVSIQSFEFKTPVHALINYECRIQKEVYSE